VTERPKETSPTPAGLHWDLCSAPRRSGRFTKSIPRPEVVSLVDFGGGTMSDLGSHWNDPAVLALKLQAPLTIEASGPPPHPELAPASMTATYEYGRAAACRREARLAPGEEEPALMREGKIPKWDSGVLFIGDGGMLLADYAKHVRLPEEKDFTRPPESIRPASVITRNGFTPAKPARRRRAPSTTAVRSPRPITSGTRLSHRQELKWNASKLEASNAPEGRTVHPARISQGMEIGLSGWNSLNRCKRKT